MNQTIGVNITPQSFQPTLHYSQGDVGRVFVINVTDYDIPTGATVTCVATKPSGMGFTVSGTVSGNSVTFTSTAEMTDEWGRFPAEIRIASGNTLLGTANFLMIGEKDPHPASTIDGTQEELIPQLTLLVNRVEAAAESVHDLTVSATTLTAGSDATATYDSTNNSIAFGIPRGADGDVTRSEFNDLKSDLSVVAVQKELPYLTPATVRHPGCVQYTWNTGEYNYYTTSVFNSWYSNIFDVEPNTKYKVLGSMYPMTPIAVFMDENDNYIGHDGFDKDYNEYVFLEKEIIVTTPANCTQLIVQRGNNKIPTAREVITVNSLDDDVEELQKTADKIDPLLIPDGSTPLTITLADNSYIDNYGYKMAFVNANYKVTDDILVNEGDELIITGTVGTVGNSYYTFLDAANTPVKFEVSTVTGSKTFDIVVPQNATKLIVNAFGSNAYVGVVENYKIKGATVNWEDKKWVCVGDSLTEVNATTTKHYFDYIADETGIETVNYGIGGTGYVNPNGTAGNFTTRMASVPTDADVYTIFGSFNDYEYCINNNIPIGSPTDSGTNTICGYINGAFSALFARVPLANLGVIAPNPWGGVNAVSGSATAKEWAENYTEALRLCCERLSIPFLDLYHHSGMRPWDASFEALTYTKDSLYGVHPDETGHAILAPKFKAFLESLLM